jgi:hypothetical protein
MFVPAADLKPIFDQLADCKACSLQLVELQKEHGLLQQRATAAEKALKGGGFLQRLRRGAKHSLCGSVAGAGGTAIGVKTRNPGVGGGLALATFGMCELL